MKRWNEWLATKITTNVATMTCAYFFAIVALVAFPQAMHDSFDAGFHALPLVTWFSQSFLQLVLLSIIMVSQDVQGKTAEKRAQIQFDAVMEILQDTRDEHIAMKDVVNNIHHLMQEEDTSAADIADIKTMLAAK